jgi:hypothetical protein
MPTVEAWKLSELRNRLKPVLKDVHEEDHESIVTDIFNLLARYHRITKPSREDEEAKVLAEKGWEYYGKLQRRLSSALKALAKARIGNDDLFEWLCLDKAQQIIHQANADVEFLKLTSAQHLNARLIDKKKRVRALDHRPRFDPLAEGLTEVQAERWLFEQLVGLLRLVRAPGSIIRFLEPTVQDRIIRIVMRGNDDEESALKSIGVRRRRLLKCKDAALSLSGVRRLGTKRIHN